MADHDLLAVVSHFVHGSRADCSCGWSSDYTDTGDILVDNLTAAKAHEAHVAESEGVADAS